MATKVLRGQAFIQALVDRGIVPPLTTTFTLRARADGAVTLEYEVYATEELLEQFPASELAKAEAADSGA